MSENLINWKMFFEIVGSILLTVGFMVINKPRPHIGWFEGVEK